MQLQSTPRLKLTIAAANLNKIRASIKDKEIPKSLSKTKASRLRLWSTHNQQNLNFHKTQ